jgi:GDP-4-dehydro-6-deoxy-D-mannose reductase
MRVFVTGAAGFVGTRLVAALRARGDEVVARDRELDVADSARMLAAIAEARPVAIVHLAAISHVPDAETAPEQAFRVNVLGTRAVLEAALREVPRARVLLVTSAAVYGSAGGDATGFDETAPLRPQSAYARTKAAADLLGAVYAERGLDVVRARPFNHTGAGRPAAFVESRVARDVAEIARGRRAPRLEVPNAAARRDFLHVEDVVAAYLALLSPPAPRGAYNIASGEALTIGALARRLCRLAGVAPEIVETPDPARAPDATIGVAAKLRSETGWRPAHTLDDALRELLGDWLARTA